VFIYIYGYTHHVWMEALSFQVVQSAVFACVCVCIHIWMCLSVCSTWYLMNEASIFQWSSSQLITCTWHWECQLRQLIERSRSATLYPQPETFSNLMLKYVHFAAFLLNWGQPCNLATKLVIALFAEHFRKKF